jgi:hypothetical protein
LSLKKYFEEMKEKEIKEIKETKEGPTFVEFMKPVLIFTFNEIVTIPLFLFIFSPYDNTQIQKNTIFKYLGMILIIFGLYLYYDTYYLFYKVGKGSLLLI